MGRLNAPKSAGGAFADAGQNFIFNLAIFATGAELQAASGALSIGDDLAKLGFSANKLPKLPSLDITGKLHGILPKLKDIYKYPKSQLNELLRDLKISVPNRIKSTIENMNNSTRMQNRKHGQRQGWEQDVINYLEKYLGKK